MSNQASSNPLPVFYVGKAVTAQRIERYASTKHPLLSEGIGKPDTKSIWYSKEHLETLLAEITLVEGDGLRVFFGTYEEAHEQFSNQICLLMVPTRAKEINGITVHSNVLLENEPGFSERSSSTRGLDLKSENVVIDEKKKEFNYGSPCPPICDGDGGIYP